MSTISNERLGAFILGSQPWNEEIEQMATELLALRKERETEESAVCQKCGNTGLADSGGVQPWGEPILIECDCTAPPAPDIADDSLPYYPQIAEYEQMMEAEQAQADTTSKQFESLAGKAVVTDEKGNLPCPFCGGRCDPNGWMGSYDDGVPMCGPECEDCGATASSIEEWNRRSTALAGKAVVPAGWKLVPIELTKEMRGKIHPFAEATCLNCGRQVVADCEDNVTASWNDMLAVAPAPVGKQSSTAEGNNDGFECTPVADLYELLTKCGECYDYTTSSKVAADWIKEGYSAREYVKLDRLQEAMTHGSSGEPDGWIPCSERMPEVGDIVLTADNGCVNVGEMERSGDSCRYFTSVVSGRELPATHWQPLPEPPCK